MTVPPLSSTPPTKQNDFCLISALIPFFSRHRYPLGKTTYNERASTFVVAKRLPENQPNANLFFPFLKRITHIN